VLEDPSNQIAGHAEIHDGTASVRHEVQEVATPSDDPYDRRVTPALADPDLAARLVEACVATHFRRYYPTYYIKGAGEVDIAYVHRKRFYPIEVKWTGGVRPKSLKQIARYPNGRIWTRSKHRGTIQGIPAELLPLALLRLGSTAGMGT